MPKTGNQLTVLLIENDEAAALLINVYLADMQELDVKCLQTDRLAKIYSLPEPQRFDVVLLNINLPDEVGGKVIRKCQELVPNTPIIILASKENMVMAANVLQENARDILLKDDLDASLLEKTLAFAVERHQLLCQLETKTEQAESSIKALRGLIENYNDGIDTLTGLPNRQLLWDRLTHTLARAKRHAHQFAVLFVDLNGLKQINDKAGYNAGDTVLQTVADRIKEGVRESDTVARFGSDEFLVILDRISDDVVPHKIACKLADKIVQPIDWNNRRSEITVSIGISLFPGDGENADELINNADKARSRAKNAGKNSCHYFSKSLNWINGEHDIFGRLLNNAIENGELVPYFQPQIDLTSGRIMGFEALVRWHHPEKGVISPVDFIPLAEKHGVINQIDEFMLRAACEQTKKWEKIGSGTLRVSVNLNANLFRQKYLPARIADIVAETGLSANQLCLEITETQVMQNVESTIEILNNLKAMNVQLSVDDFGTGYSSLSYLKKFPLDMLKIDRAFVDGTPGDHHNVAITTAIVALAKSMGLIVIAEGVEEQEQLDFLQTLDCNEVQGYFVGRPGPADAITSLLESDYCLFSYSS